MLIFEKKKLIVKILVEIREKYFLKSPYNFQGQNRMAIPLDSFLAASPLHKASSISSYGNFAKH